MERRKMSLRKYGMRPRRPCKTKDKSSLHLDQVLLLGEMIAEQDIILRVKVNKDKFHPPNLLPGFATSHQLAQTNQGRDTPQWNDRLLDSCLQIAPSKIELASAVETSKSLVIDICNAELSPFEAEDSYFKCHQLPVTWTVEFLPLPAISEAE